MYKKKKKIERTTWDVLDCGCVKFPMRSVEEVNVFTTDPVVSWNRLVFLYQRVGALLQCQYCCIRAFLCSIARWQCLSKAIRRRLDERSSGFWGFSWCWCCLKQDQWGWLFFLCVNERRVILLWKTRTSACSFVLKDFHLFQFPQARPFLSLSQPLRSLIVRRFSAPCRCYE